VIKVKGFVQKVLMVPTPFGTRCRVTIDLSDEPSHLGDLLGEFADRMGGIEVEVQCPEALDPESS